MKAEEEHVIFERLVENNQYYFDENMFHQKENRENNLNFYKGCKSYSYYIVCYMK